MVAAEFIHLLAYSSVEHRDISRWPQEEKILKELVKLYEHFYGESELSFKLVTQLEQVEKLQRIFEKTNEELKKEELPEKEILNQALVSIKELFCAPLLQSVGKLRKNYDVTARRSLVWLTEEQAELLLSKAFFPNKEGKIRIDTKGPKKAAVEYLGMFDTRIARTSFEAGVKNILTKQSDKLVSGIRRIPFCSPPENVDALFDTITSDNETRRYTNFKKYLLRKYFKNKEEVAILFDEMSKEKRG